MSETKDRRGFLSSVLMWLGVVAGYGLGLKHFLEYLVPLGEKTRYREFFVGPIDELKVGQSKTIRTPRGDSFVMARTEKGLLVLSDICPHLGCRVYWQNDKKRFYCPCHAGVFTPEGKAIAGPPADAGQELEKLQTVVRGKSVFVLIKES